MAESYLFDKRQEKPQRNGLVMFLLFLSFVWTSLFTATSSLTGTLYLNFGNMLDTNSANFSSIVFIVISEAIIGLLIFELIFYIYRKILQFKIYSFIVPANRLKTESRVFYIYRNIFYGLFLILCFLFPYLYQFAPLVSLASTFILLIFYANHLNKTYAEPIIGHFVFKNFCYPIFVYQALILLFDVIEVL